jgi:ligand-binding SRPBCC domain-containing protein
MTVLRNSIHIEAPPEKVWAVLSRLDALHEFDPGVERSQLRSKHREGIGADRHCDLRTGGWFRERVTVWDPPRAIEFELHECTLPVLKLWHHYTLVADGKGTRVDQRQEYQLKYGPIGKMLDALVVRRKWDAGIKSFFAGLKRHVENGGILHPG